MRNPRKFDKQLKHLAAAAAAAAAIGAAGAASAASAGASDSEAWSDMQAHLISADDILSADVTNGRNHIGEVTKLVLSADESRVQYILYDIPFPYSFLMNEPGFTTFDSVAFDPAAGAGVNVRFDSDSSVQAPEQLQLTAGQADNRLVGNLLDRSMYFSDGESREVRDMLIDRQTGEVAYWVVDMETASLFDLDRRAIPADMVSIDEGGTIKASVTVGDVDNIAQKYNPAFL